MAYIGRSRCLVGVVGEALCWVVINACRCQVPQRVKGHGRGRVVAKPVSMILLLAHSSVIGPLQYATSPHTAYTAKHTAYTANCNTARTLGSRQPHPHIPTCLKRLRRNPLKGRWSEKHELRQVIDDTLDLLVERGGAPALAAVRKSVPTYHLCNPR